MTLVAQVKNLSHGYVRAGGKNNRRQQASRMLAFAAFASNQGVRHIGQVGNKHVVSYWRMLRKKSYSQPTLYSHWLAISHLWRLIEKSGEPPKPKVRVEADQVCENN